MPSGHNLGSGGVIINGIEYLLPKLVLYLDQVDAQQLDNINLDTNLRAANFWVEF